MDFANTTPYDTLVEKWNPLLSHEALPEIAEYRDWETDRKSTRLNSSH